MSRCLMNYERSEPPVRSHRTPRPHNSCAAGPLFSITFSLCSGDFEISGTFSPCGLSVVALAFRPARADPSLL